MKNLPLKFDTKYCLFCNTNNFKNYKEEIDPDLTEEVCLDCNKFYRYILHSYAFSGITYIYDYIRVDIVYDELQTEIYYTKDKSPIKVNEQLYIPDDPRLILLPSLAELTILNQNILFESLSEVEKYIESQIFK